jgi:hypothetical protein
LSTVVVSTGRLRSHWASCVSSGSSKPALHGRAQALDRSGGSLLGLGHHADEAAIAHYGDHARHALRHRRVQRHQLGAGRGRPQHAAMQQLIERAVVDETWPPEHLVGDVDARDALPGQLPCRDRLAPTPASRQQGVVSQPQ